MRILLTQPAIGDNWLSHARLYAPNLGLLYLAGYLKKHKPDAVVCYLEGHMSRDDHIRAVKEFRPDLYGITLTAWALPPASATIDRVKEIFPNLVVVAGGPYPSINSKAVLEKSKVDYCVIGEGEQTFLELTDFVEGKRSLNEINGLAYRIKTGDIECTPKRKCFENLDQLPFPDWTIVDVTKYKGPAICKKRPYGHVSAARGCPYNCIFCTTNAVWKMSRPWYRVRSPESIAEEVKLLHKLGVREITLRAGSFNANLRWAKEVCQAIEKLKLSDAVFNCELRVDKIDTELAALLRRINVWCVHLGIESMNSRVLEGLKKHYTVENVREALRILKDAGIKVYGYFMMFNFWEDEEGRLQTETPEEVENSINFIKEMSRSGYLHHFSWAFCTPYEGSELYRIALKHNLISDDRPILSNELFDGRGNKAALGIRNKMRRKGMLLQFALVLRNGDFNLTHVKRGIGNLRYVFARNRHESWKL